MGTSKIPTDGRAFAVLIGAKPKPVGWYARRRFLEKIGVREKATAPGLGKAFVESLRAGDRK